jgi:hypothetical protein
MPTILRAAIPLSVNCYMCALAQVSSLLIAMAAPNGLGSYLPASKRLPSDC